jgi:hypothetical protein
MAIQSSFRGNFTGSGAKAAGSGRFGTIELSGVSDFATHKPQRGINLKKLAMIAALVACASPAFAESFVSSSHCRYSRYYGYSNCRETWTKIPDPVRNLEQERLDTIALQKEDAKWAAFCKPSFKADEYGVRRASYTARGCEFGRSE